MTHPTEPPVEMRRPENGVDDVQTVGSATHECPAVFIVSHFPVEGTPLGLTNVRRVAHHEIVGVRRAEVRRVRLGHDDPVRESLLSRVPPSQRHRRGENVDRIHVHVRPGARNGERDGTGARPHIQHAARAVGRVARGGRRERVEVGEDEVHQRLQKCWRKGGKEEQEDERARIRNVEDGSCGLGGG